MFPSPTREIMYFLVSHHILRNINTDYLPKFRKPQIYFPYEKGIFHTLENHTLCGFPFTNHISLRFILVVTYIVIISSSWLNNIPAIQSTNLSLLSCLMFYLFCISLTYRLSCVHNSSWVVAHCLKREGIQIFLVMWIFGVKTSIMSYPVMAGKR